MSDIEKVKKLREATGAGFKDCNLAIKESGGDIDKAIEILRVKGISKASKKMSRNAKEGVIAVTSKKERTSLIEVNCETDFVAKNDNFISLAQTFLSLALDNNIQDIDALKSLDFDGKMSVGEKLVEQTGVIGEKLELSNYNIVNADYVTAYIHPGNKLASLVGFNLSSVNNIADIGKNIAMQIAAMNPVGLNEADITQDIIDKEVEIGKDLARQEGKPEEMLEKIAMGRLKKFFKENTLINQTYIKDSKKTVMQYLKDASADLSIVSFKRVSLG